MEWVRIWLVYVGYWIRIVVFVEGGNIGWCREWEWGRSGRKGEWYEWNMIVYMCRGWGKNVGEVEFGGFKSVEFNLV